MQPPPVQARPRLSLRFPVAERSRWIETIEDGDSHQVIHWESTCSVSPGAERDVVDCRSHAVEGTEPDNHDRFFVTAAGAIGFLGNDYAGEWREYDPPQIHMPADARPGTSWESDVKFGGEPKHRSYRVEAFGECPAAASGLTIVEETRTTSGSQIVVRQSYCEGLGVLGSEVITTRPDGSRRRTTLRRDP